MNSVENYLSTAVFISFHETSSLQYFKGFLNPHYLYPNKMNEYNKMCRKKNGRIWG